MSEVRAVMLDFYGTLVDVHTDEHRHGVFEFLAGYLQYHGLDFGADELRYAVEAARSDVLKRNMEEFPETDLEEVFARILEKRGAYSSWLVDSCCKLLRLASRERLQLFPDTRDFLRKVRGFGLSVAVVSNAQRSFISQESRMLGLVPFVDRFVISTEYGFLKPDTRLFLIACDLLRVRPEEAVHIGDDAFRDVVGPKRIGMRSVLVRRQQKMFEESDYRPDFVARDLSEALSWLSKFVRPQD